MAAITGSVGRGGMNRRADAEIVQRLLNNHMLSPQLPLIVDGIAGPLTIAAIEEFQERVAGFANPDGRVDVNGQTIKALEKKPENGVSSPPPRRSDDNPVLIRPDRLANLRLDPTLRCRLNSSWGEVKHGETWLGPDGKRFILTATNPLIFYLLKSNETIWAQPTNGFLNDVNTFPFNEAARHSEGVVLLARIEMGLMMGVAAALCTPAFVSVVASHAFGFYAENRTNFPKWKKILQASLEAQGELEIYAPTLRNKVFEFLFIGFVRNVLPSGIPSGVRDPDKVSFWVGVLAGALGKKVMEGRLVGWTTLLFLCEQVILRTIQGIPCAAQDFARDLQNSPGEILQRLEETGRPLSRQEQLAILSELKNHPREIKAAIQKVVDAAR